MTSMIELNNVIYKVMYYDEVEDNDKLQFVFNSTSDKLFYVRCQISKFVWTL